MPTDVDQDSYYKGMAAAYKTAAAYLIAHKNVNHQQLSKELLEMAKYAEENIKS